MITQRDVITLMNGLVLLHHVIVQRVIGVVLLLQAQGVRLAEHFVREAEEVVVLDSEVVLVRLAMADESVCLDEDVDQLPRRLLGNVLQSRDALFEE